MPGEENFPFPMNVCIVLTDEFNAIEGVEYVFMRPLRPPDPNMSFGVFPLDWTPVQDSVEMVGVPMHMEASLQAYQVIVQSFVKHTDAEEGIREHAVLSKLARSMLYRGESLRVRLAALTESSFGVTERLQRWGVRQQRFLSNEVEGTNVYLSSLELWFETEVVQGA